MTDCEKMGRFANVLLVVFVFLGIFLFDGCAKRVEVKAPVPVDRETYAYQETAPGVFVVWVKKGTEAQAKEEICTTAHICTIQEAGRVFAITRTRK